MPRAQLKIGGVCLKGHDLHPDNIKWRPGRSEGSKYIQCRGCARDKDKITIRSEVAKVRASEQRIRARLNRRTIRDEADADVVAKWLKAQNATSAPWNLNKAKAPDEFQTLNMEFDKTRGLCLNNPDPWTEFRDPRWPDEAQGVPMPTADEAKALCAGCPVLEQCKTWGLAEKPAWGVVGGIVWIDGGVVA